MKKNWLTVAVLALSILNLLLTTVIVFTMVPNTINTNKLISKVASSIDFQIESQVSKEDGVIKIEDIEVLEISEEITINLADTPGSSKKSYALISASLSLNSKVDGYSGLKEKITANEATIKEMIRDEFSKYNRTDVITYKDAIKDDIQTKITEFIGSDIVVGISLGKFIVD